MELKLQEQYSTFQIKDLNLNIEKVGGFRRRLVLFTKKINPLYPQIKHRRKSL